MLNGGDTPGDQQGLLGESVAECVTAAMNLAHNAALEDAARLIEVEFAASKDEHRRLQTYAGHIRALKNAAPQAATGPEGAYPESPAGSASPCVVATPTDELAAAEAALLDACEYFTIGADATVGMRLKSYSKHRAAIDRAEERRRERSNQ